MTETDLDSLRARTRALCAQFPDEYWRETDRTAATRRSSSTPSPAPACSPRSSPPSTAASGLGLTQASVIMEEINKSGGHSAACHAQMYTMGALLRHGSDQLKNTYLPLIAKGELRLQAFSITEPAAGSDTTSIITSAERDGDALRHHRAQELDQPHRRSPTWPWCWPAPATRADNRTRGLTLFLVDLRQVRAEQPDTLEVMPVRTMFNYATNQVHYHGMRVPADHVIGEVDAGLPLRHRRLERRADPARLRGHRRRLLVHRARRPTTPTQREVFGRPIGANQGVQFPLADAYMKVRAADMMRYEAARLFDAGEPCGAEANMAKHLASEASWAAANAALDTHGGNGFVDQYDIERKFRETRMFQVAPVNNNLIKAFVATKVLGLPRSY